MFIPLNRGAHVFNDGGNDAIALPSTPDGNDVFGVIATSKCCKK